MYFSVPVILRIVTCVVHNRVFAIESTERGRCDQIIDIYNIVCVAIAVLHALKVNNKILILFSKLKGEVGFPRSPSKSILHHII